MYRLQLLAAAAATAAAALYLLIGVGALDVGTSTQDPGGDLLGFGLAAGTVHLVMAAALLLVRHRGVWALVAVLNVAVIAMYLVVAQVRVPPLEVWGLTIKALQLVVLSAVLRLLVTSGRRRLPRSPQRGAHPA